MSDAIKHDQGKDRMGLLPSDALREVAKVLTFGAEKYSAHNWVKGFDWERYYDAAQRHMADFWGGEDRDPESGFSHLAHAICCLMFLLVSWMRGLGFDDRIPFSKGKEAILEAVKRIDERDKARDKKPGDRTYAKKILVPNLKPSGVLSPEEQTFYNTLKADWERDRQNRNVDDFLPEIFSEDLQGNRRMCSGLYTADQIGAAVGIVLERRLSSDSDLRAAIASDIITELQGYRPQPLPVNLISRHEELVKAVDLVIAWAPYLTDLQIEVLRSALIFDKR